ncbi:pantoate--beta-alanine ligase [Flavobacterium lacus]|uniref:Pantothenate synthetase n=2 Tax=Flavobacterium lacus TaxID=1353778 RepID=A0A328WNZ5_9FLAO|nr:pantoate--beta-alanine ligase [Flavobacterium lacus]
MQRTNQIYMLIFNKQSDLKAYMLPFWTDQTSIGFVPTMGALHEGHLSLLRKALQENKLVMISIFVNPTQFNNPEDLENYPRTLDRDVQKIATLSDKVVIYAPTVDDIYNGKTVSQSFNYDGLEHQMEGKHRPGHFDGVGTIVKRLFEIVQPKNAYFGEKDFQQLQIIKKLAQKYNIPVNVVGCPIHREKNGLAMSSRNERLSEAEKEESALIFKTLTTAKKIFGTKSANEVSDFVKKTFEMHPQFSLEYFQIADEATLKPCLRRVKNKKYRAFIAVFINNIRLIDTISLN